MRLIPHFTFKISIQDFLEAYECQNDYRYLCDFTEKHLIPGRSFFWRLLLSILPDSTRGGGFREQWLNKFGGAGWLIEGWIYNHPDFVEVNKYKNESIAKETFNHRTFRILCLRRAAELHPDWILKIKV